MQDTLSIKSRSSDDWIEITGEVASLVEQSGMKEGIVTVFVPHTTAGVTIQENADPPLKGDITRALNRLFPKKADYKHCEDNASSHMKAMLVGSSIQVPFTHAKLALGTWQGIYFCEFDGPRDRNVVVHITGS